MVKKTATREIEPENGRNGGEREGEEMKGDGMKEAKWRRALKRTGGGGGWGRRFRRRGEPKRRRCII